MLELIVLGLCWRDCVLIACVLWLRLFVRFGFVVALGWLLYVLWV